MKVTKDKLIEAFYGAWTTPSGTKLPRSVYDSGCGCCSGDIAPDMPEETLQIFDWVMNGTP